MSIEWSVPVRRPITVGDLVDSTGRIVADVLGVPAVPMRVRAEPGAPEPDFTVLTTSDLVFYVEAADLDVSDATLVLVTPGEQDPVDPDSGTQLTFLAYRAPVSMIVSVSAAIAGARLSGSVVIDEPSRLGSRIVTPQAALARLRASSPVRAGSVADRADQVAAALLGWPAG